MSVAEPSFGAEGQQFGDAVDHGIGVAAWAEEIAIPALGGGALERTHEDLVEPASLQELIAHRRLDHPQLRIVGTHTRPVARAAVQGIAPSWRAREGRLALRGMQARRAERPGNTDLGGSRLLLMAFGVLLIRLASMAASMRELDGDTMTWRRNDGFWPLLPYVFIEGLQALLGSYSLLLYLGLAPLLASTVLPLWWTSRHLQISRDAFVLAVVVFALYPYLLVHVARQPDTGLSIAMMIWSVGCFHRWSALGTPWSAVCCATSFALLVADRSQALLLFPFLGASELWLQRTHRSRSQWALLVALLSVCLGGYASVRWALYEEFGLLTKNGGYNLLVGHNDYAQQYLLRYDVTSEAVIFDHRSELCPDRVDTRAALDEGMRDCALDWIQQHPGRAVAAVPWRVWRHFDLLHTTFSINSPVKNLLYTGPYLAVLVGALAATCRSWQGLGIPWGSCLFLWAIAFVYALPNLVTLPLIRLRMHTEVYWILLASTAWVPWLRKLGVVESVIGRMRAA